MLMALRFEPSYIKKTSFCLTLLRKNQVGSKRKAINIYFAFILQVL